MQELQALAIVAIPDCIEKQLDRPVMQSLTLAQEVLFGDSKPYKAWLSRKHLDSYRALLADAGMAGKDKAAAIEQLMQKGGLGSEVLAFLEVGRVMFSTEMSDAKTSLRIG